jgi:VCBS repeat-containing protein
MWSQTSTDFPVALQVLINKGDGTFTDATERLNPDMKLMSAEMDYNPQFLDLDNSGIETLLFSGSFSYSSPARQSDYVLLNDGTGRLHIALHDQFFDLAKSVAGYLGQRFDDKSTPARFIAVPKADGSLDFVASVATTAYDQDLKLNVAAYQYINVDLSYNAKTDFTTSVTIKDRNHSALMRTWAGDDVFYDLNGAAQARLDGGLGQDTVIYSGKLSDYTIALNTDGTVLITSKTLGIPQVADTLKNFETLKFSDRTLSVASVLQDLTPVSSQLVSTPEDTPRTITLAENTSAPVVSKAASHGTTSISGGTVIYTPAANYNGTDSFVVTASDGKGGTATQTINISVTPVNDAPVFAATSQAVSATAGAARTIALAATDVDGDALTYTVAKPGKGTASISGSTLTYTPGATASGSDSFVVTASDGKGGTATQTINATVALAAAAKAFTVNTLPGWVGSVGGNGSIVGSNGFEDIKVLYGQIALDGSFNRGGDIVRVLGKADSYVIGRTSASSAYIEAGTTTKVTIPIGSTGLGIVYDDGVRKLSFSGGAYKIGSQTFSADPTKITSPTDGTALPTGANPSTQAVVSLLAAGLSGGTAPDLTITGKVRIVGTNGVDVIKLGSTGGDLTFDGSFNRGGDIIILNKAAGDYSAAKFSGSTIVISSGIEKLTIPMGSAGLTLRFTDGDRTLVFKNSAFNIGDQIISSATATPLTPSSITLSADQGVTGNSAILDATGKVIFTDDAAKTSNVILKNFGTDDIIRVTGATASQYNFAISALDPKDLEITYTDAVTSATNTIVLDDVIKADVLIENYATAATALGWNFMAFG